MKQLDGEYLIQHFNLTLVFLGFCAVIYTHNNDVSYDLEKHTPYWSAGLCVQPHTK